MDSKLRRLIIIEILIFACLICFGLTVLKESFGEALVATLGVMITSAAFVLWDQLKGKEDS